MNITCPDLQFENTDCNLQIFPTFFDRESKTNLTCPSETETIISNFKKNFSPAPSRDFSDSDDDSSLSSLFYIERQKSKKRISKSPNSIKSNQSSNPFDDDPIPTLDPIKILKDHSGRKMADDSLRKKFKTMLENRILETVNKKMKESYPLDKKIKFKKLPQNYLKNATIEMNKMSLNMTLEQRFLYDFKDTCTKKLDHNRSVLSRLNENYYELERSDSILKLFVKDLIQMYIESSKYKEDLMKIEEDQGKNYARKFDNIIRGNHDTLGYVEYFLRTPGNKSKKIKKNLFENSEDIFQEYFS
jgi:hypothetical protein